MAVAPAAAVVEVEDDFDKAFDEAVSAADAPVVEGDEEPASEPAKGASKPLKEKEESAAAPPAKTAEEIAAEEAAAKPEKSAVEIATEALTAAQEAAEARREAKAKKEADAAAAAKAAKDAEEAAAAVEAPYELTAEEQAALDSMAKEFPNEFKAMQARLKQESKAMTAELARSVKAGMDRIAELEKAIKPVAEVVHTREQDAHFAKIKTAHTDFDDIIKAVPAWIEKLPAHRRIGAQAVYDGGDAASIIELVNDYKKEHNIVAQEPAAGDSPKKEDPKPAAPKKPSAEDIAAGVPVGSRRAAPSVKGAPDKEDYDAAWEEATKDER